MKNNRNNRRGNQTKKVYVLGDVESTLDEHAYKAGIVPFEITEKDVYDGFDARRGVSERYLALGKAVSSGIKN